ncbi:MAG: hypothetical protein M1824_005809 [Vezdaea acicularis]|nr:MAG: hypothetical protein M1824_005809 [Vezdaea acicularis]
MASTDGVAQPISATATSEEGPIRNRSPSPSHKKPWHVHWGRIPAGPKSSREQAKKEAGPSLFTVDELTRKQKDEGGKEKNLESGEGSLLDEEKPMEKQAGVVWKQGEGWMPRKEGEKEDRKKGTWGRAARAAMGGSGWIK